MKNIALLFFFACGMLLTNCKEQKKEKLDPIDGILQATIAIGSCNREDQEQRFWDDILSEQPDAWIWLGDNIYGDTNDTLVMQSKYRKQKGNPEYQQLRDSADIFGIWDDHDFGKNDAGKEYVMKEVMRDLMFEFLDVPAENPAWQRAGGYQSYDLSYNDLSIKLILLDSRYFRDQPIKNKGKYISNFEGSILGEQQWKWLETELKQSKAEVNIIGNGIQIIPAEHAFEKWNNFPNERQKLFDLIDSSDAKKVILLSGDRHLSELSRLELPHSSQIIYDITSSGMTHSYTAYSGEPNQYRVGEVIASKSYAVLRFYKTANDELKIRLFFMGDEGEVFQQFDLN